MSKQELDFQTNESEPDAQKKFPDRKSQVSASLSTRVNGFAEQLELDEDDIEKMIRDHFGRSIELFYYRKARSWLFDRIRSQLIDDKESDADPLEHKGNAQSSTDAADFDDRLIRELASELQVNRRTLLRWKKKTDGIGWEYMWRGYAAFNQDSIATLPRGSEAVTYGLCQAVFEIRKKYLDKDCEAPLSAIEFDVIAETLRNKRWIEARFSTDPAVQRKGAESVSESVRWWINRFRKSNELIDASFSHSEIRKLEDAWAAPLLIFVFAMPYDWNYSYLDDENEQERSQS